jgi:hypothetical protein
MALHKLIVLFFLRLSYVTCAPEAPTLPHQFSAKVEIIAHLVDRAKPYPPWLRVVDVKYDFEAGKASAEVLQGFEEGKTFLRRYDNKSEYMVRGGEYAECQRSYLGEAMPAPVLPSSMEFVGEEPSAPEFSGYSQRWEHWMSDLGTNRIHVFVATVQGQRWPVRVTDEQVLDGESVPLMTYDFKDLRIGPPDAKSPDTFGIPKPYDYRSCSRNIGGFPYLHLFHHYLRF